MPVDFLSENLALDFAGTLASRRHRPHERLASPPDLVEWSAGAGLAAAPPLPSDAEFESALAVREATYRVALAIRALNGRERTISGW